MTRRRRSVWLLLLFAICLGSAAPAGAATSEVWRVATGILHRTRQSVYQHRTEVVEEQGLYKFDCSGFVSFVLAKCASHALSEVESADRPRHPRAFAFYDVISRAPSFPEASTNGWSRIERVNDLLPGDIVAWRRRTLRPFESTGHVVIVHDLPREISNGVWQVRILDSTTRPHAEDTRAPGQTGLGCGTIWIRTDPDGRPNGYMSNPPMGRFVTNRPIAMGRIVLRDSCALATESSGATPGPSTITDQRKPSSE